MPDTLNKQALVNLLIDSPLREPIKINLIDIVNNTAEPDLPKVYSTITKELEIFQKATERRMKLADETIAKLGGVSPAAAPDMPSSSAAQTPPPTPPLPTTLPPAPTLPPADGLTVPPLDLPPLPQMPPLASGGSTPPPTPAPLGAPTPSPSGDEAALAEIQKELDSLKSDVAADANPAPAPTPTPMPQA